jgi:hypothetical protein
MLRCAEMQAARHTDVSAAIAVNLTIRASAVFEHVAGRAWNDTAAACGGGIYWSTKHSVSTAELFVVTNVR